MRVDRLVSIKQIIAALTAGNVRFSEHALIQMSKRGLTQADVLRVAHTCVSFKWQETKQTFLVAGYAENGKGAAFSCIVEGGVVVVTVMWRHLSKAERSSG
jgi:hypothetical protein